MMENSTAARCMDFDVFIQGSTLDDLVLNIKEAIQLHFIVLILQFLQ